MYSSRKTPEKTAFSAIAVCLYVAVIIGEIVYNYRLLNLTSDPLIQECEINHLYEHSHIKQIHHP